MRRRIVMFITTLALSTTMLVGCGNDKSNNSVTSSATEEPVTETTEGPVVNEDDSNYDESDMAGDDGVVGDVVDDAADAVDDVVDDTADVVDDATGNQGTDGTANNAGQSEAENDNTTNRNNATAKPNNSNKKNSKKTSNKKNTRNNNNTNNKKNNVNKNR